MKIRNVAQTIAWSALALSASSGLALADFKVRTPDVNEGERAVETVGDFGHDSDRSKSGEQSYTAEAEYGMTNWWTAELEFEFERESGPGESTKWVALTLENTFQFSERGEYWMDTGFFLEYGHSIQDGDPDAIEFGPLLRKDFWGLSNTLNLLAEKEIGPHSSGRFDFSYAFETRIDAWQLKSDDGKFVIEPGFQFYGAPGDIGHFASWSNQDNRFGPQLFGKIFDIGPGALQWNAGILFGLTDATPSITPRWQLEYEIKF